MEEGQDKGALAPKGFKVAMTRGSSGQDNCCIFYRSEKLEECKPEDDPVAEALLLDVARAMKEAMSEEQMNMTEEQKKDFAKEQQEMLNDWDKKFSQRVCIRVFKLKEKGSTPKFVAISMHAPKKNNKDRKAFLDDMRTLIQLVVGEYGLPVLVGGDFNTDEHIQDWERDRFTGLHYESERKRIDFITMKVPVDSSYLKLEEVKQFKFSDIAIPSTAEGIDVKDGGRKIKVKAFRSESEHRFFGSLCDHHMPLTVAVTYCSDIGQPQKPKDEKKRRSAVKKEAGADDESTHQEKMETLIMQHREDQREINELRLSLEEWQQKAARLERKVQQLEAENEQYRLKESKLKRQKEGVSRS